MFLCHRVVQGNIVIVLNLLHMNRMCSLWHFCLLSWQSDTTATESSLTNGVDDITADRTDIEFGSQHIARPIFVGNTLAGEQFCH